MVIDIVAIISILGLGLHSDHRTDRLPTDIRWDRAGAVTRHTVEGQSQFMLHLHGAWNTAQPESQSRECLDGVVLHHTTITFYRLGMRIIHSSQWI